MTQSINAIFFTENVKRWLADSCEPKFLHIFDDVCNLINEKKEILSIVNPEIGNGPFNLVVEEPVVFTHHLNTESKVLVQENLILLGELAISLAHAQMWNPIPNWEALRKHKSEIINRLSLLQIDIENETILQFSNSLNHALIENDILTAKDITKKLAGLGIGLTPSGDDFIIGALYASWIIHPHEIASLLAKEIAETAWPLTTSLSAVWIRSAGRGEAGILWHQFFNALVTGKEIQLHIARLLSVGETSGSDALSGFLGVLSASKERVPKTGII